MSDTTDDLDWYDGPNEPSFEDAKILKREYKQGIALWKTKSDDEILVKEMQDSHVLNCYIYLNKVRRKDFLQEAWIEIFKEEIKKRKIK